MALETFYFFLSVIALLGAVLFIGSILFFRITNKTILGEVVKPGMPAHKSMRKLTGNRNLIITIIFALILIANLIYGVARVIKMNDPTYASFLFIVAPTVTIFGFSLILRDARRKLGGKRSGKW